MHSCGDQIPRLAILCERWVGFYCSDGSVFPPFTVKTAQYSVTLLSVHIPEYSVTLQCSLFTWLNIQWHCSVCWAHCSMFTVLNIQWHCSVLSTLLNVHRAHYSVTLLSVEYTVQCSQGSLFRHTAQCWAHCSMFIVLNIQSHCSIFSHSSMSSSVLCSCVSGPWPWEKLAVF